jgi:hypothetical protein
MIPASQKVVRVGCAYLGLISRGVLEAIQLEIIENEHSHITIHAGQTFDRTGGKG